jgi:plastocyanin
MQKQFKFILLLGVLYSSLGLQIFAKQVSGQLEAKGDKISDYSELIIYVVTPAPKPQRNGKPKTHNIVQVNKEFRPLVLGVRSGDKVNFENRDNLFHNVFSLDPINKFDLGLYKGKVKYNKDMSTPLKDSLTPSVKFKGNRKVNVFCNIHQKMQTTVYSFNHPYFTQPDRTGAFTLKVPPNTSKVTVRIEGAYLNKPLEKTVPVDKEVLINFEAIEVMPSDRQLEHKDKNGKSYKDESENEDDYY